MVHEVTGGHLVDFVRNVQYDHISSVRTSRPMGAKSEAAGVRLVWAPLALLSAHESIKQDVAKAEVSDFDVGPEALRVFCHLNPVVAIPAGDLYQVIGGARTLAWHLNIAQCTGDASRRVLVMVVSPADEDYGRYRPVEQFLGPLVLGELSAREVRSARKGLKATGDSKLRPVPIPQLRPIERAGAE